MKPTIGSIVIYNHPKSACANYQPTQSPAIIQHVFENGSVRLVIFGARSQHIDEYLIEGTEPGQWQLPEKTEKKEQKMSESKDINKMFEDIFSKLNDLIKEVDKEIEEEKQDQAYEMKIRQLSCKIVQAVAPYATENKEIMLSALLDTAASFGCYCQVSKKDQVECFESLIDANLEKYEKNKVKIEKIKAILKGE